jgi:hypothetical protein
MDSFLLPKIWIMWIQVYSFGLRKIKEIGSFILVSSATNWVYITQTDIKYPSKNISYVLNIVV